MGVCACAVKNTGKKQDDNQITAEDQNNINTQIQAITDSPQLQKTLSVPSTVKRLVSIKEKTCEESQQQIPIKKWSSLALNRAATIINKQKSISYNSNTGSLLNSNVTETDKQTYSQSQLGQQLTQKNIKIAKQTAKNRNWVFNQSPLLGQGMGQEDNVMIQRSLNIETPIKLQAIQLKVGVTYHGQWFNAMRHGYGIQVWEDGSRYQGQWEYNQMNGQGKIKYSDGDCYQGEWKDDSFHGNGKYTCYNGHFYEGQWYQGKKQGKGKQIWEDGQVYIGQYKDDLKCGRGCLKFKDGSSYEGQFFSNQIHGRGKYVWKNNRQYDGDWAKNKMSGFGILKWIDGRYYKGQFSNDKRHGKGQMYYTDGSRYVGNWNHGKQDGHGEIYEGAKLKFVGQWKDGKKIKKNHKYESSLTLSQ